MKRLRSNIWKLYVIKSLRSFMLIMPVIVPFFNENGLSLRDIFLLQALFSVTTIALEVPTGYFADVFSRKAALIVGGAVSTIGYIVYSMSYGFWGFLAAETLLGIGVGFVSGADSAMLYDTLLTLKRDQEYLHLNGRNNCFSLLSEGVASIIGGSLAITSLRLPLYVDILVTACIVPIALLLTEPEIRNKMRQGGGLKKVKEIAKYALHGHGEIKWLIMYSSVVSASTLTMAWFVQPYLMETHVSRYFFGVIWTGLMFVAAFFSWYAHRIERILGRKVSFILLITLPVIGYGLASTFWSQWSFLLLICFYVTRGILDPVLSTYINDFIDSDIRATVLSVKNVFGRLIFVAVILIDGWVSDHYSLQIVLMVAGGIFLCLGIVCLSIMRYKKML